MTIAVCIRCGASKLGALTPCCFCQFEPGDNLDKARAMILTDHFLSADDLNGIGLRIQTGLPVNYPEEPVAEYVALFEKEAGNSSRGGFFIRAVSLILFLGVAAYLLFRAAGS